MAKDVLKELRPKISETDNLRTLFIAFLVHNNIRRMI